MDDDPQGPSRADGDGRLDIEIALHQRLAGAIGGLTGRFAKRPNDVVIAAPRTERKAGTDAENGCQRDALEQLPAVQIELIGKAGIAAGVRRRQIVDDDRGAVGPDDALPDDERALLAEGDDAVIACRSGASPCGIRDASGDAVEDMLRDLSDDETRQVGIEP